MKRGLSRLALALALVLALGAWPAVAGPARGQAWLKLPPMLWSRAPGQVRAELLARVAMREASYAPILAELPLAWQTSGGLDLSGAGAIREYNQARLDYLNPDAAHPGGLGLWLEMDSGRTALASDPLETVTRLGTDWADSPSRDSVSVAKAEWREKSLGYILGRMLSRPPDTAWHYTQNGLSTFVQRRFAKDLTDVGALDVVLDQGQEIQVNVVVALDKAKPGKLTVLDWYDMDKGYFDLGQGRRILRLYLGRHLRRLYPGAKGIELRELALMFFRESQDEVLRARNVEKIIFVPSGLNRAWMAEHGLPGCLPAGVAEPFSGRGQLSVDLTPLSAKPYADLPLASARVIAWAQAPDRPASQALESARLLKIGPEREIPVLQRASLEQCQGFSSRCSLDQDSGLVSQAPLWDLDFTSLARPGAPAGGQAQAVDVLGAQSLFQSQAPLSFQSSADGLTIRSQADRLTLNLPLNLAIGAKKRLGLWLELGKEHAGLSKVEADIQSQGQSRRLALKPGFSTELPGLGNRIDKLSLIFTFQAPNLALTLGRLSLQVMEPDSPGQGLFSARYLTPWREKLDASLAPDGTLALKAGNTLGMPQWLLLDLSHTFTPPTRATLTLGDQTQDITLPNQNPMTAVYLRGSTPDPAGGHDAPQPPPYGGPVMPGRGTQALQARTHEGSGEAVASPAEGSRGGSASPGGEAWLTGTRLAAWPEVLAGQPLVELSGSRFGLPRFDAAQGRAMADTNQWMDLAQVSLPKGSGALRLVPNDWLEVEALRLSGLPGPDLVELAGQEQTPAKASTGVVKWPMAGAWAAGAVGLWLASRRGRLARGLKTAGDWLQRRQDRSGRPVSFGIWLAALVALAGAGGMLGLGAARQVMAGSCLLAVPIWRGLRARWRLGLPSVSPAGGYLAGFLAAAALGAVLRLAGLLALSELFGLAGLCLFLAAVFLRLREEWGS